MVKLNMLFMKDKIDENFDKAEKVLERSKFFVLKVIATILAVSLSLFAALDEISEGTFINQDTRADSIIQDSLDFNEFMDTKK